MHLWRNRIKNIKEYSGEGTAIGGIGLNKSENAVIHSVCEPKHNYSLWHHRLGQTKLKHIDVLPIF